MKNKMMAAAMVSSIVLVSGCAGGAAGVKQAEPSINVTAAPAETADTEEVAAGPGINSSDTVELLSSVSDDSFVTDSTTTLPEGMSLEDCKDEETQAIHSLFASPFFGTADLVEKKEQALTLLNSLEIKGVIKDYHEDQREDSDLVYYTDIYGYDCAIKLNDWDERFD